MSDKLSINSMIQLLIEWENKYPKASVLESDKWILDYLKDYSRSVDEYADLVKEYKKVKKYYLMLKRKLEKEELTPEQKQLLKEANMGGVFGFSSQVEALAKKYRVYQSRIADIIRDFGSVENYIQSKKNGKNELPIEGGMVRMPAIDINKQQGMDYDRLCRLCQKILGMQYQGTKREAILYDSGRFMNILSNVFTEQTAEIIRCLYGINDEGELYNMSRCAKKVNIPIPRIEQIRKAAIDTLATQVFSLEILSDGHSLSLGGQYRDIVEKNITPEEVSKIKSILDELYNSSFVFNADSSFREESQSIDRAELKTMYDTLYSIVEQCIQRDDSIKDKAEFIMGMNFKDNKNPNPIISIYELGLSNAEQLENNGGIKTVSDLTSCSANELLMISGVRLKRLSEIREKLASLGLHLKGDEEFLLNYQKASQSGIPKQEGIIEEMGQPATSEESETQTETETETPSTVLEQLRAAREELARELEKLKAQTKSAEELLASYDRILNGSTQDKNVKGE